TISGTAEHRTNAMTLGEESASNGTLNANGGILQVSSILGKAGTANANFNGTQINAKANSSEFINELDSAVIQTGGLLINSGTFNLIVPQAFSGSGNIVKTGTGTLLLNGDGTNTGKVLVNAGTVAITNTGNGGTDFTLANGTSLNVNSIEDAVTRPVGILTLGSTGATTLNFDLGDIPGNPIEPSISATSLVVNGTVTLNVADLKVDLGLAPLLQYTSKSGTGSFVLGTLPSGVTAKLVDNGSMISLDVTKLAQPRWDATASDVWNTTTVNWVNANDPSPYSNGTTVIFNDFVSGVTQGAVKLNSTVTPAAVTFENSLVPYSITGSGSIGGATGLVKKGNESLTLGTPNTYTGVTTLQGGTTFINTVANGGAASSLGSASASAANIVLSGGSLAYTGLAASTDRGLTISAIDTTLSTTADLTLTGEVASVETSNVIKAGTGNLILAGAANKT
ncbi:MAG: hypothetical protein EOP85_16845, partial [Verrucomicrobiaceae bacterium]